MSALRKDIAAFDEQIPVVENEHRGEWVVFHDGNLIGFYPQFEDAASDAVDRFGGGPYLIRQVGVGTIQLSAAMVFKPAHAHDSSGL